MGLLLAAITSAAFLAYFAERARPQAGSSHVGPPDGDAAPAAPSGLPGGPRTNDPIPPGSRAGEPPSAAELDEVGPLPSPEQIEAVRGAPSEVNPVVRDQGIDGLVGELKCKAPSHPFELGRTKPGGVGCVVDGPDKVPLRVGHWVLKDPSGMLDSGDFEFGQRTGTWIQYHPNGYKAAEGELDRDMRIGVWREWDSQGNFVAYRTYKQGALDGLSVIFQGPTPVVEVWDAGRRRGAPPDLTRED